MEQKFCQLLSIIVSFEKNLEIQRQELAKENSTQLEDIKSSLFMSAEKEYFISNDFKNAFKFLDMKDELSTDEMARIFLKRFCTIKDRRDIESTHAEKSFDYIMSNDEFANFILPQKQIFADMVIKRDPKLPNEGSNITQAQKKVIKKISQSMFDFFTWTLDELIFIQDKIREFMSFAKDNDVDIHNFINSTFDIVILKSETYVSLLSFAKFIHDNTEQVFVEGQPQDVNQFKIMFGIDSFFKLQSWDTPNNTFISKVKNLVNELHAYSD